MEHPANKTGKCNTDPTNKTGKNYKCQQVTEKLNFLLMLFNVPFSIVQIKK